MKIKININKIIKKILKSHQHQHVSIKNILHYINFAKIEKPEDKLFEQGVLDLTNFIDKINLFEKITN